MIDGAGLAVVPGLTDSHIHPFWGTRRTRGVDLRSADTLGEVCARLAAERERCGPGEWVLGHSAHYEPFHDAGLRAGAIADAVRTRPRSSTSSTRTPRWRRTRHWSGPGSPARGVRGVGGDRRRCRRHAHRRAARERRDRPRRRRRARLGATPSALDAYAETLRRLNAVGLTGAHVMIGDPELLDDVRALEARDELTLRMVLPMHQEPAIDDEEVERRLALADEHGAAVAGRDGEVLPRRRARVRHRVARRPRAGRRERPPVLAERRALRGAGPRASPGGLQRDHARGRRRRGPGALDAYEAAGRRGAGCTASSTSRR